MSYEQRNFNKTGKRDFCEPPSETGQTVSMLLLVALNFDGESQCCGLW
jgi:hypothetical protein